MSEFAPRFEQQNSLPSPERHEALPTPEQAHHETAAEQKIDTAEARRNVAETADVEAATHPLERLKTEESSARTPQHKVINRELKDITKNQMLNSVRRRESRAERSLSKAIHQPAVRVISEAAGKTVSRPSGLLGGGLMAFVGSSVYLYLTKHVGMDYNYFVFLLLFAGGFILGVVLELIVYLATARHRATD